MAEGGERAGGGERMRLSWNAADGIMQRAVARGLARRPEQAVRHLSVDGRRFAGATGM